jgi:uncharacterized protein
MICKLVTVVILQLVLIIGTSVCINPSNLYGAPTPPPDAAKCGPDVLPQAQSAAESALPTREVANIPSTAVHPKVVFQINQAADASTILRFVTNYLIAEPAAEVAVVGYGEGVNFMLKGAADAAGKPYADQLQVLVGKGVHFKVCNNTLKARSLTSDAVTPSATVVPGAVNEIIRLQTKEGYAYFRH